MPLACFWNLSSGVTHLSLLFFPAYCLLPLPTALKEQSAAGRNKRASIETC